MGASQFVGRVGGLAVALGVGAAMFTGAGVASADRSAPSDRGSGDSGASQSSSSVGSRGATAGKAPSAAAATVVAQTNTSRQAAPANDAPISVPAAAAVEVAPEPLAVVADEPVAVVDPVVDPAPVVEEPEVVAYEVPEAIEDVLVEPKVIIDPVVEEPETATPGDVTDVVMYATGGPADGADNDESAPFGNPLVDLLLASFVRRENTDASATASPTAQATTGLTTAPVTTYFDGVLQGNLNVTSASGCGTLGSDCKLVYSFVDSSAGGKLNLNNVPAPLPGGGAGSYTFLPYATWIDSANPVNKPTPTGTQDFTVRVSENTKFDQTITSIPLIGLIAEPIIKLLQETPFLGNLLAPIIGASVATTVSVNVGQLVTAGKQVAYTYKVTSFDGVEISMNYFPASAPSLVLPGQEQATIFNGPGLGSPGETNPYGVFQAAGSVPGLSVMRGQGLPAPFSTAPIGFNVITWDPRGEFASGGILQLDNPFFEGRDVSALIDWGLANTPLLVEQQREYDDDTDTWVKVGPAKPDIAMMGGSYGGGIQLTTVDPRIQAIVPSIAWNSLNDSLYPTNVFKTAWANTLALALLEAGARTNSLIDQGILYGNLFGFLTPSQQAALASSGPTALLTKLNIPTMYDQGIVDALFPLQQALNNAQTQLDENPFFAGENAALVKMIWFCGGHGVCTTQSAAQQTSQNTAMFLENMLWVNNYAKPNLADFEITVPQLGPDPVNLKTAVATLIAITPAFQWWDQNGVALSSQFDMPWTSDFQDAPPVTAVNATGGRINSFTSRSGPLKADDAAGAVCAGIAQACGFPLNQVFATEAKNAINVDITVPRTTDSDKPSVIVGAPKVSFTYSGTGNAKAVYAQIVDNATGQVLGNINTAIPVTLDGKEHTIDAFSIANIAYTAPELGGDNTLTLQIVANSSLYQNNAVIWSVDISDVAVSLPTTTTATPNGLLALLPV